MRRPGGSFVVAGVLACALACAEPARKQSWDLKPAAQPQAQLEGRAAVLERWCAAGQGGSCLELASLFAKGAGGAPLDPRRMLELNGRACVLAEGDGCRRIERLLDADDTTPADLAPVEATFRAACDRGVGEGCVGLATLSLQGLAGQDAPQLTRKLLSRGCEAKDGLGCLRLGLIELAFPDGADLDPALRLIERGCALGAQLACVRSADRLLRSGTSRTYEWYGAEARALERLRTACRGGEYAGCLAYAEAVRDGRGMAADRARARELMKAACDDGHGPSCGALGSILAESAERADAVRWWKRACELRDGDACLRLAENVHALPGRSAAPAAAPPPAAVVRLVQKACVLHAPDGCATLSALHARGAGVPRDARRAAELARKACRLGAETGCDQVFLARALR